MVHGGLRTMKFKFNFRNLGRDFDWFSIFETVLVVVIVAAFGFVLNMDAFKSNPLLFVPMMILQILVSAYAGHQIFPRIFKNRELEAYQETVVSAVIPILKARNKENVNFAFSEAISRAVGGIERRIIMRFMSNQDERIRSFFAKYDESGSLNASVLEGRVLNILEQGPEELLEHQESAGATGRTQASSP